MMYQGTIAGYIYICYYKTTAQHFLIRHSKKVELLHESQLPITESKPNLGTHGYEYVITKGTLTLGEA